MRDKIESRLSDEFRTSDTGDRSFAQFEAESVIATSAVAATRQALRKQETVNVHVPGTASVHVGINGVDHVVPAGTSEQPASVAVLLKKGGYLDA